MTETFFIADTHFGHKGILTYEKTHRPFASIEEHDEEIIKRWNDRVRDIDSVWVLGDLCFGKKNIELVSRLKGMKRLILGNHDLYPIPEYLKYFDRVCGVMEFDRKILTHIPIHKSQFYRYTHNLHGHLHSHKILDSRYINVSCEQINLTPISYGEILDKIKKEKE